MSLSLGRCSSFLQSHKGFSLIEASVVLGIVGVVTAGIWTVMASSKQAATSNALQQQVLLTTRNIRDYFAARALPSTALDLSTNYTADVMRTAGVFTEDMCPANCVSGSITLVYNSYGGRTLFQLPDLDANNLPDANRFRLLLSRVQKRGCIELGMRLASRAPDIGFVSYTVDTNAAITSFPIALNTLDTQCSAGTNGSNVIVTFKLRN